MALPEFDWALVRSFLAVLDAGSLMGAARKLGAQQPTLSRHILELESQLGAPLFERTGRGVTPTALALTIAGSARQMEAGATALTQAIVGKKSETQGTIRITTSQVAATWLLPPILAKLSAAEPAIGVELVASNQLTNLLRREADIAVRMVRPQQSSLVAKKLFDIPLGAAAHRGYLGRMGIPRHPKDLLTHRLIGYDRDETILRGFARLGFSLTRDNFSVRTDDQVAYGQLVASGVGIGFVALYTLRQYPEVVQVLPELAIPALPCWLAVHREIRGSHVVRKVYEFLAEEIPRALRES